MATILENIQGSEEYNTILRFMIAQDYGKTVKSSYAKKRLEKWYGYHSNLQSVKGDRHAVVYSEDLPEVFERIRLTHYPEADSLLMAYGKKPLSDNSILPHRDHAFCKNKAIMINFGSSIFTEHPYDSDPINYKLKPGDIVEIDTKIIHSSEQISNRRYNATFRQVRPEWLPSKAKELF